MNNRYLARYFSILFLSLQTLLPAQCPITVNAGVDIYVCNFPQEIQLNGSIEGPYLNFDWSPQAGWIIPTLELLVSTSGPTSYVLTGRYLDESVNLIVNGDFEQGNTGFTNNYNYSPGNLVPLGTYDVLSNPQTANDAFADCADHTSGSGNMLAAHASVSQNNVWCQNVTLAPHSEYQLSYWVTSLYGTPREIRTMVNPPTVIHSQWSAPTFCEWTQASMIFSTTTNSSAMICLNTYKSFYEAAVAIDDIVLHPICRVRDTVFIKQSNIVAKASPDLYSLSCSGNEVTLHGTGSSTGPQYIYSWETQDGNIVSGQNTLHPVVNAPGTYTLTVSVENIVGDCAKTATAIVEEINPLQASISTPQPLKCAGTLSLVGNSTLPATSTYQWTASAGGNIVSGGTNAIAVVNQPGEYNLLVTNTATGCTADATVTVAAPVQPTANIQPPGVLNGDSDTLTLQATVTPANVTFNWATPNGYIVSGAGTSSPAIAAPGMYMLTVTNPASGCTATDTVWVTKAPQCPISVDAGEDIYVCNTPQEVQLAGEITGDYLDFVWSPAGGLSSVNELSPTATILQPTSYVLTGRMLDLSTNLIVNGDFEQGNTGFTSQYIYAPGNLVPEGTYNVTDDPEDDNPDFLNCNDHTSGSGQMLTGNAKMQTSAFVWCQNVQVTPYTDYSFSFWATTLMGTPRTVQGIILNMSPIGTPIYPPEDCEWGNFTATFNSGNNIAMNVCIQISKAHNNSFPFGFAIDDIVMNPVCKKTDTVYIKSVNVVAKANPTVFTIPCAGNNVTLNGTGSSAGPGFVYNWETTDGNIVSGQNTLHPVVNAPGTYTLNVIYENGIGECAETASVEVSETNLLQAGISAPPTLNCLTNTTLLGSSTQPANSAYQWTASPGGHIVSGINSSVATVDQPGEYYLLVTNTVTGCTAEALITIAPPSLPAANASAAPITCASSQTTLSGAGSSIGSIFTYAWSTTNGHIVSGQNNIDAVADTAGIYVLLVSNTANGCSQTDTVAVTINTTALPVHVLPADTITCVQNNVTLATDSATAGAHRTYLWTTLAGGNIVSGADSLSPIVNAPGLYVLLVTDTLNACTGADTISVIADNDAVVAIANAPEGISCLNSLVMLDAGGSSSNPTFLYQWSTPDGHILNGGDTPNPTVDAPGTYHLLLTNPANGCSATDAATVTADLAAPDLSLSAPGVLNCNTTSVTLLSSSNTDPALLNHAWTLPDGSGVNTGNSPSLDAAIPGAYNLLLTNTQNGCTATGAVTLTQHDAISVDLVSQQDAACFGSADGTLTITAVGGDSDFSYLWNNDATTPSIAGLAAGTYTVTVTDGENCSDTETFTVAHPNELLAGASATPPSGIGASDGMATANPQGGTMPYYFLWSNGQSTQTITGLPAGFYAVTVTDAHNCTAVQTVEVWGGECNVQASIQAIDPLCHGASDGQATALPTGGAEPYSFEWTSGSTEQTATGLAAGTYGVTVIDVNNCAFSGSVSLGQPPMLTLAVESVVHTSCANSAEGSATVMTAGGTGATSILWSNGQQGPTSTGLTAGEHIATVTDANGCTANVAAIIQALDQEPPVIDITSTVIDLGPSGSVELSLQNLGATVTDNCGVDNIQIVPDEFDCFDLGPQQVTITAQDAAGNSSSETLTVTFVDNEVPQLLCPANITRCAGNNTVEYAAPVAVDNCLILGGTFALVAGLSSGAPFPQGLTTNTYNYTDVSGNTGTCSFGVEILSPLTVSVDSVIHDIGNQHTGGIDVTVTGSQPGYTYEWLQNGQTITMTEDLSGVGAGVYSLLVTDAAGCKTAAGPLELSNLVDADDPLLADRIEVYPNPGTGRVFVLLPDGMAASETTFEVFDARGRRVLEQHSNNLKKVELDLTQVAAGLYSILIRTGKEHTVRMIAIQR